MPATPDTLDRIKQVLRTSLKLEAAAEFTDRMPLIGGEYDLDSLDILLVITNVEKEFGVRIREGTIDRAAFATLGSLADFIEELRHST